MNYKEIKAQRKADRAREKHERFNKLVSHAAYGAIIEIRKFTFVQRFKFSRWLLFGRGEWKGF